MNKKMSGMHSMGPGKPLMSNKMMKPKKKVAAKKKVMSKKPKGY